MFILTYPHNSDNTSTAIGSKGWRWGWGLETWQVSSPGAFFSLFFLLTKQVYFLSFKHDNTMPATTTPNESIQLVGGSHNSSTLNIGIYDHQRVFMTRWWVFTAISATPHAMLVSMAPNESIQLVGGCHPPGCRSLQPNKSIWLETTHLVSFEGKKGLKQRVLCRLGHIVSFFLNSFRFI